MQEKKIVTWCLVVLFVALMIVYTLMYMRNVEIFTAPVASQTPPTSDLVQGT
jgi:preprotein translocase subunit SecG